MPSKKEEQTFRVTKKHSRSPELRAKFYESNDQPSLAKPNESLSIRQILNRSVNGIEFENSKTPYYEQEASLTNVSFNQIQHMDFNEKHAYLTDVSRDVNELTEMVEKHQKELEAEQAARMEEERKRLEYIEELRRTKDEAKDN